MPSPKHSRRQPRPLCPQWCGVGTSPDPHAAGQLMHAGLVGSARNLQVWLTQLPGQAARLAVYPPSGAGQVFLLADAVPLAGLLSLLGHYELAAAVTAAAKHWNGTENLT